LPRSTSDSIIKYGGVGRAGTGLRLEMVCPKMGEGTRGASVKF